ncbi:hypothetical protein HE1_00456 [Holospora elegans E1]|uniref:Uncharacterized protein n=1 Tax=Holospora elegans E1 TaxID=1427503 RepID=A0A023DXJ7_9PROT|nr:hypothetical protein [Holospora elegans]GAJ46133.1 hypothetical protein HE1_00456 [Holospora elegans E1]
MIVKKKSQKKVKKKSQKKVKKKKKQKTHSNNKGDEKRVALVEKTLKDMAVALSGSRDKSKSVEDDVLLA